MSRLATRDYEDLERQFVHGSMSLRALCRDNDIKNWSTVSAYAKRHGWVAKREEAAEVARQRANEAVARQRATALSKGLDDAVGIAQKAMWAFFDSLEGRWVGDPETGERVFIPPQQVSAKDFIEIVRQLALMDGQPTSREAHLGIMMNGEFDTRNLPMDFLREVAALARERGASTEPGGSSPLPRLEGARPVN